MAGPVDGVGTGASNIQIQQSEQLQRARERTETRRAEQAERDQESSEARAAERERLVTAPEDTIDEAQARDTAAEAREQIANDDQQTLTNGRDNDFLTSAQDV